VQYDALLRTSERQQQQRAESGLVSNLGTAIRTWDIAQILGEIGARYQAEEEKQKAAEVFKKVREEEHLHSLECPCGQVPLLWAAENSDDIVVRLLLAKDDVDPDLRDYLGRTPLLWAAWNGHAVVVNLLLATGKAKVNAMENDG
jgi:hypothetical protein